jgi:hypothetical protein
VAAKTKTPRPCACQCCGGRATSAGLLVLGIVLAVPSSLLQASVCSACRQLAIATKAGRQRLARKLIGG